MTPAGPSWARRHRGSVTLEPVSNPPPIEGIDWHADDGVTLRLENGRLSGSGGINRLMGDYTLTADRLSFGAIATTMMAGPAEQTESEQRFLHTRGNVARWFTVVDEAHAENDHDDDQDGEVGYALVLADDDDAELLRFTPGLTA